MAISGFDITDSSVTNLAKVKYGPRLENFFRGTDKFLSRVNEKYDLVGTQVERPVETGYIGGAGFSKTRPRPNRASESKMIYTSKTMQIGVEIDRRTIKHFKNEGAFVDAIKEQVRKVGKKWNWLRNYIAMGPGDGSLGTISSVTNPSTGVYNCVITDATWVRGFWCKDEVVQVGTTGAELFYISAVTPSTKTVQITRVAGATAPVSTNVIYLQNGANSEAPYGAWQVLQASSSTLYSATVGTGWQSTQVSGGSAAPSVDLINQLLLDTDQSFGETPNMLIVPFFQYRRLLALAEDMKRYFVQGKVTSRSGEFSFDSLTFLGKDGPIPIYVSNFIHDAEIWALNDNYFDFHFAGKPDFIEDSGSMFHVKDGTDDIAMYFAGYGQFVMPPTPHGRLYSLATS